MAALFVILISIFLFMLMILFRNSIRRYFARMMVFMVLSATAGLILLYLLGARPGSLTIKQFMVREMKQKYCAGNQKEAKCNCILTPLLNDITSKHSSIDLIEVKTNKVESVKIIFESLKNNKTEIQRCLKEKNAIAEWDNFVNEVIDYEVAK